MAASQESISMALFCDFENVALGVRDAQYERFDIKPVLERLLLKGSIVVKKAYCDWERYKGFKATMHEANFELIEIPHVRQSGKNSADIRLVVDALDLCYTKSHVNTFVIISGDSDFSPLVSKLRENAKQVIGVGVKQSTSDLLIANCDEFIFYDDLVRDSHPAAARRDPRDAHAQPRRGPEDDKRRKEDLETRRAKAIAIAVETFEALVAERGDSGKIWASMLKEAIKRRRPDFNESYFGFRSFGSLLEEAQARGLLEFGRDDKSGAFVYRSAAPVPPPAVVEPKAEHPAEDEGGGPAPAAETASAKPETPRRRRGTRKPAARAELAEAPAAVPERESPSAVPSPPAPEASEAPAPVPGPAEPGPAAEKPKPARGRRGGRKSASVAAEEAQAAEATAAAAPPAPGASETTGAAPTKKPAKKPASRSRRPRSADAEPA